MSPQNRDTPVTWSVESQTRTTQMGANGQLVRGWLVAYLTSDNVHGDVFVSDAEYAPDNVRSAIALAVAQNAAVHRLTGEVR